MNKSNIFLFRGKSLPFKAVKSQMTEEIANAFNEYGNKVIEVNSYDDKGELQKKKKKIPVAQDFDKLYDSISVDPNTGEVEIIMSPYLPTQDIEGDPLDEDEEEYEGIPVSEWDDKDAIQKWIDKNLKGLVIVKDVKPEGNNNLVEGVWNGDIPVGMNVSSRSISNKAMIKNILVARTTKNLNSRKAKNLRIPTVHSHLGIPTVRQNLGIRRSSVKTIRQNRD